MTLQKLVVTKKAQSALEFLTTYGWAFLVILIMIGALSYFGVLDPSRFLPDKCLFGAGLGACSESIATPTNVSFKLINALGADIYVNGATLNNIRGVAGTCTGANGTFYMNVVGSSGSAQPSGSGILWQSGKTAELAFTCTLAAGERMQSTPVQIYYKASGSTYNKTIEGDVALKRSS